ncbi:M56 family metallopeptidase [Mucilaginibacter sp. HMF5004]|uniref:M56 family metallopeptidase n=1 Tax=Mucilaginibacter rivuli TaxID=2857527 RepID=UPI001C5FD193|nr:M56 family metallopeptidase [Mucilaginibacter rivuli]MBW4889115.1 M56 family metallopeptidase [Mucilaginibacter rivuli]
MPAMFVFLLKVNIALLLFCAGYYLVLRHLTFYTLNRIYLVAAMLFATVYPNINLDDFAQRHEQLARPVQIVVYSLETPAQNLVKPLARPDYWYWAEVIFWIGVTLLACRLLVQLLSMYKMYRNSTPANIHDHDVRVVNDNIGPFSFWKSIYINPARHDAADMKAILLHEQVHVSEWHTIDILLAELSTIFYWFNPGVWLMKKAVRENIEFITDRKILKKGMDSKAYQYSLVNVILTPASQSIVNHFNLSTIKKRIIMMNAKRSSALNLSRYVLLVPVVVALLLVFTVSKAELTSVTKSSAKILKALKSEVGKITFNEAGTRKNIQLLNAVSHAYIQTDTSHQNILTLADTAKKTLTELPIYINGVKSGQKGLADVNPEDILKMIVYRDPKIKNDDPEKSGYISVITKGNEDSEPVKAFNEKMHKQYGVTIMNSITNFVWNDGKPTGITNIKLNGVKVDNMIAVKSLTGLNIAKVNGVVITGDKLSRFKVNGDTVYNKLDEVVVVGHGKNDTLRGIAKMKLTGVAIDMHGVKSKDSLLRAMTGYKVSADGTVTNVNYGSKVISVKTVPGYRLASTPISFTDKLVIIDGREASQKDLKKLSADKIQTVNNLGPAEAEKKYGDKAKSGAILITTKN